MCAAATAGQYQILEFLVVSANDYGDMGKGFLQRTLVAGDYEVIKLAAGNCRWPIVEWLSSLLGENDKVKVESKIATIRQFEPIQLVREMFDEDSPSAGEI